MSGSNVPIILVLLSFSWIFSLRVDFLYAMSDLNAVNTTTQPLTNDSSTTSSVPSVLHLSPVPVNNGTTTSQPSTNNKADTNVDTHDTGSNSLDTSGSTMSTSNHHKDNTNSHDLAHKIINNIRQKFKVGDVPFP
jgi:hypothetical protein